MLGRENVRRIAIKLQHLRHSIQEELLCLQTPLTRTTLTPQTHLRRTLDPTLQMRLRQVRQRLNENWAPVQTLRSLHTGTVCFVDDFEIEFVECLNMVRGEGNGDEDNVGMAALDVVLDCVAGLCAQPGGRADLGLPAEAVLV